MLYIKSPRKNKGRFEDQYKMNKHNFRMKEFSEIDDDNYFLFLGCSNTFGIGLFDVEETYSYKICKEMNVECVNLGIPSGSNDHVVYLLEHVLLYNKLPKHIIINWTSMSRRSYWLNGEFLNCSINGSRDSKDFEPYLDFIYDLDNLYLHFDKLKCEVEKMCKNFNIPLTQISMFDRQKKFSSIRCYDRLEDPTDCGHPGALMNQKIANDFLSKYKSGETLR